MPESVVLGDVEFGTELEVGETVILEPIMQERNAIEGIVLNREEDSFTIETRDGRELLVLKTEMDHPSGEKAVCWEVFDSPVQVWKVESVEKKNKEITFQNLSTRQEAGEFVVVYRVKWPNGSEYEYEVPFSSQDVFKDFLMKNKHRPGRFANYLKNHATSVRKLSEERNLSEGVFSNLEVWWEDLTSDEKELVLDELFGNEDYKDVPLDLWDKRDLEKLVKYFGEIEYGSNVKESTVESILDEDLIPSPNWAGSKVMDHDNNTGVVIDQKEGDGYVSLYIKMDDPELEIKKIVLSLNPESPTEDQRYWYYLDEVSGDWISFLAYK
jgi:hypothetical protein